jgi:hypothetical protein
MVAASADFFVDEEAEADRQRPALGEVSLRTRPVHARG